jgi:hypothetical protein
MMELSVFEFLTINKYVGPDLAIFSNFIYQICEGNKFNFKFRKNCPELKNP